MSHPIPPAMFAPSQLPSAIGAHADPLEHARSAILVPAALDENRVASILGEVMGHAVDYSDVYFQAVREESWSLEDGIVKDGAHSIDRGVGVRALAGERTGFAYSDEVVLPALLESARAARAIARSGSTGALQAWHAGGGRDLYLPIDPIDTLDDRDKVRLLEEIDREARALDPRISQVMASLSASHETIMVLASDGTLAADVRPLVRLNVSVIIEHEGRREQGYAGGGGRFAYTEFRTGERWRALVREAVRTAQVNLEAVPAPAGTMTVVLGPGWPGVLLHEAVGHGLEGDFNRKGTSAFSGRIGQRVAAPECNGRRRRDASQSPWLAQYRRRGYTHAVHDADRERRAARLPPGQAQRAADGRRPDGQRPPRVVRAPDAAADDEHLHAAGASFTGGDRGFRRKGPVLPSLRRRPGGHHLGEVRVLR